MFVVKHVGFRILLQNFIKIICLNSVMHSDKRQLHCIMKCFFFNIVFEQVDLKAIN